MDKFKNRVKKVRAQKVEQFRKERKQLRRNVTEIENEEEIEEVEKKDEDEDKEVQEEQEVKPKVSFCKKILYFFIGDNFKKYNKDKFMWKGEGGLFRRKFQDKRDDFSV